MDRMWIFVFYLGFYTIKPSVGQSEFEVQLVVPKYVERGSSATLQCKHNVRPEILFKVTWLKVDRGKFFEFINGRNPPFRNFTVEGGEIDWDRSNETQVTLKYVDFNATGQYYCEVSTDTPIFTKASGDEIMNVFLPQPGPPIIKFRKRTPFSIGERLFALCNTTRARPAPTITWLINGKKVDPQFVRTHHMRSNRSHHRFQQQQQQQQQRQEYYQQYLHQYPQQYRVPYLIDRYDKSLRWSGSRVDDDFSAHTVHHHDSHHHTSSVLNNPFSSLANMHDIHEVQHRSYENKNKHLDMKKHLELKKHMELMKHRNSSNRKYRRHINENAIGILRSTLKSGGFGPETPNNSGGIGTPSKGGHMSKLAAGYTLPLDHPGGGRAVALAAAAVDAAAQEREAARQREAAQQPEGMYSLSQLNIVLTEQHVGNNGRVEITCLSTIPSAVGQGEQYADYKTYSVKVEIERPEMTSTSTTAPSIGMAALGNGGSGVGGDLSASATSLQSAAQHTWLPIGRMLLSCSTVLVLQLLLLLKY